MNQYFSGYKKKFFQGWYFKQSDNNSESISFIPGYAVNTGGLKTAFIQVLTAGRSYYNEYAIGELSARRDKLEVKIGGSVFSEEGIKLDISGGARIKGELAFSPFNPPAKSFFCPNIMGPFDFLPKLECRHYIYSLHHEVNGVITAGAGEYVFNGGRGYCEGDRGVSFPTGYIWLQSNLFGGPDFCVSVSIADVPYLGMNICGVAAIFKFKGKEYRFATYNGAKITLLEDRGDTINILLTRGGDSLEACLSLPLGYDLKSPHEGRMKNTIKETLGASLNLKVKSGGKTVFREDNIICSAESAGKVRCMSYQPARAAVSAAK